MALNKVYKPLCLQGGNHRQVSRPAQNSFLLKPKSMVHLDWVSTEDGSHVLSVAVGTQIQLYSTVSRDIIGLSHSVRYLPEDPRRVQISPKVGILLSLFLSLDPSLLYRREFSFRFFVYLLFGLHGCDLKFTDLIQMRFKLVKMNVIA